MKRSIPIYPIYSLAYKEKIKHTIECVGCGKMCSKVHCKVFASDNYSSNNSLVHQIISSLGTSEQQFMICKKCDAYLVRYNILQCYDCHSNIKRYSAIQCNDGDTLEGRKILICKKCHSERRGYINCICCNECLPSYKCKKYCRNNYDMNNDIVFFNTTEAMRSTDKEMSKYICMQCDKKLSSSYLCTCCHSMYIKNRVKEFNELNYDFEEYIVKTALSGRHRRIVGTIEYICVTCHNNLRRSYDKIPRMPQNAAASKSKDPGCKFLQAIYQKPEFICTCCHRWLFRKSVKVYDDKVYDFSHPAVELALKEENRHPMDVITVKGIRSVHEGIDYDWLNDCNESSDVDIGDSIEDNYNVNGVVKRYEYICLTCHKYLKGKSPKLPPQSVANGLKLCEIPPELSNLTDLERKLIALRIPFMVIFCLVRYGSQYKVRGGCTNVPTSLDQIIDILPRLSNEVEFHPMKLKRRMIYKSNYMYNFIRKDVVCAAIKWLKNNNKLYSHIGINEEWADDWINSDFAKLYEENEEVDLNSNISSDVEQEYMEEDNVEKINKEGDEKIDINKLVEEREINEDIVAAEKNVQLFGKPTADMVQFENLEQEIYSCAPGENNTPCYVLLDDKFEVLAFPDLFPYGEGGFMDNSDRTSKLSMRKYFQQRLMNCDGRFAKNIEYLFCAQYATDIKHLQDESNIAIRLKKGKTLDGERITAGMLRDINVIKRLVKSEHAYKFLRHIRGSPAYWQQQLYELLAMLRSLGIPTFFLTLSPADLHWVEMIEAFLIHEGKYMSREQIMRMPVKERAEKLKTNPVTAVRMFQHRVESFFKFYLLSSNHPIGEITEYAIKIEFQQRGSPHAHCLLWVKDAPKVDVDDDEIVCSYIDKYISGSIPDGSDENEMMMINLLKKYESHSHNSYCRRNHKCRFGFPKAPSLKTVISREISDEENVESIFQDASNILTKVYDRIENGIEERNLIDILNEINISEEQYMSALKISSKGKNIILKRNPRDVFINGCNHEILRLWGANVDFQFILDEYSTIVYVCSYMMKSEKAMGETLKAIARDCINDELKVKMRKLGKAFIGRRVVGAPEAAMRELSMWLIKKSVKVLFVNSNMKDDRISLPKSAQQLEKMDEDDDDIYVSGIHERYSARPDDLENMCLAKFAVNYDPVYSAGNCAHNDNQDSGNENENEDENDLDCNEDEMDYLRKRNMIRLKNEMGYMRKRKKQCILRIASFKEATEPERYYYSRLLLYLPWRTEEELLNGFRSYTDHYHVVKDIIEENALEFNLHTNSMNEAIDFVADNGAPEMVWDKILPIVEEENTLAKEDDVIIIQNIDDKEEDNNEKEIDIDLDNIGIFTDDTNCRNKISNLLSREARKDIMSNNEYRKCIRMLNKEQLSIIKFIRHWCKSSVCSIRKGKDIQPFHIYLSGPGGVGKSHVIKMIRRDIIYFFQQTLTVQPDQPIVLLTAPTGLAAFNIGGITMHSAFMLKTSSRTSTDWENKSIMQNKLSKLELCIIDEISMVGQNKFNEISETLKKIKQCREPFGGVSILAVGDFYQLSPVFSVPVYRDKEISRIEDFDSPLWNLFNMHELTTIMRQKDCQFTTLLNSIRSKVPDTGSEEDNKLKSRELKIDHNHKDYPKHAMHVFAQNQYCDQWNNICLNSLEGEMVTINCIDRSKDNMLNVAELNITSVTRETGNLAKVLNLKIGARVMLSNNIDTSDGLTNGAMGTVYGIIKRTNERVIAILVRFDINTVGQNAKQNSYYKHIDAQSVPIKRIQADFGHKHNNKTVRILRMQFPLLLCWAVTIHKCQGMTLPEIVVDMSPGKGNFFNGQAYVAFSRVTEFEKLHIINYNRNQIKVNNEVAEIMRKMRERKITAIKESKVVEIDRNNYITLYYLNVCNLKSKLLDIQNDKYIMESDIICFTETHLNKNDEVYCHTVGLNENYYIFRRDRNSNGGGLLIFVHKRLNPVYICNNTKMEFIAFQVKIGIDQIMFLFCYKPPTVKSPSWIHDIISFISILNVQKKCIVGDFNEDLLSEGLKYINMAMGKNGFIQHISSPTRDSGTLIDHLYTININSIDIIAEVEDCYYSDHDIITSAIKFIQ